MIVPQRDNARNAIYPIEMQRQWLSPDEISGLSD
jgi:hypothetical protein